LPARDQELTDELLDAVGIVTDQLGEVRNGLNREIEEAEAVLGSVR